MAEGSQRSWWKVLGYVAFFLASFVYFVYATFPYTSLVQKFSLPVQKQLKARIEMKDLSPYLLTGVKINNLNIKKMVSKGTAEVQVEQLKARLAILPLLSRKLRVMFNALLAQGTLRGMVDLKGRDFDVRLQAKGIQLAGIGPHPSALRKRPKSDPARPLLEMLFAPVFGKLSLRLQVKNTGRSVAPGRKSKKRKKKRRKKRRRRRRRRRTRGVDIRKVNGAVILKVRNLSLGPGYFNSGQMGELPVPLLRLGKLNLQLKIGGGYVQFVRCTIKGTDADAEITGKIRLRQRMAYSYFRGMIKFKVKKALLNRPTTPGLLKGAITALGTPRGGFHRFKVYFPFRGRPRFTRKR